MSIIEEVEKFFAVIRDIFGAFPLPIQLLVVFVMGLVLLVGTLRMVHF